MKYLIIGAGGTGGAVGAYMAKAGKDVTLIARGSHLKAMQEKGLKVIRPEDEFVIENIKACTMEEYEVCGEQPDVVFVCVKGYSIDEITPFIQRICGRNTIVIPVLNIYGTGAKMQPYFPDNLVTDGCIYIASEIMAPGELLMKGYILRVVFGLRKEDRDGAGGTAGDDCSKTGIAAGHLPRLEMVRDDLNDSGILGILSDNIERDALMKFSYVSAQSTCGLYYDVSTGPMQQPGEIRDCFASLIREIVQLAGAMGISFEEDLVERNLKIMDDLVSDMTTSMQRDIKAGKPSEIDGQIFEVVRLARKYGVYLPSYEKIAKELTEIKIRKSTESDLPRMMEIYAYAREFMAATGNPHQWGDNGNPQKEILVKDIEKGVSYVMETGGRVVGVFAFIIGEDPTYGYIENGRWLNNETYGTIHRVAGDGTVKGLLHRCVEFCSSRIDNLRIDTHHDNKVMQSAIKKCGFEECGTIYVADGSPRIAYQKARV